MIVYDDLEPNKLKIYNKGVDVIKKKKRQLI